MFRRHMHSRPLYTVQLSLFRGFNFHSKAIILIADMGSLLDFAMINASPVGIKDYEGPLETMVF